MNLLYQPDNPQAILARCKIKPWDNKKKIVIRNGKTSFDMFMTDEMGATTHEKGSYSKLIVLPDVPFTLTEAKNLLCLKDEKTAENRVAALRNKGLLTATQYKKPIMFVKTQLALDFIAKMKPIVKDWEKCKQKKTR